MAERFQRERVIKVDPTDPAAVARARAEIASRHAVPASADPLRICRMDRKRIADMETYLWRRYGCQVPDDDAGREDLALLLNYIGRNKIAPRAKVMASIRVWARWMQPDEANAMAEEAIERPKRYRATTLGARMRLTRAEAATWGIETIRPYDKSDAEMVEERKDYQRDWKRADRAAKRSGRPRGRPKSEGVPAWVAAGASSKAAHYRNLKKVAAGETKNAGTPYKIIHGVPGIKVSPSQPPEPKAGAPKARRCQAPIPIHIDDIPEHAIAAGATADQPQWLRAP
jgi:hypothetical protein